MAATLVSLQPPPQYDVKPPVPVIEYVLSREEVQKICGEEYLRTAGLTLPATEYFRGCAQSRIWATTYVCVVWRINDEKVRRHEYAHCSGWPADHPGGH